VIAGAGVEPLVANLPPDVEVSLREAEARQLLFVLNTSAEPRTVEGLPAGETLIGQRASDGTAELPGYGCLVTRLGGGH
jgi:beta-galactosidase